MVRNKTGVDARLRDCNERRRGVYSAEERQKIDAVGAKPVYAQITPVKCRTVAAFLKDVYFANERPWVLTPTPEPDLPEDTNRTVADLVAAEVMSMLQRTGVVPSMEEIEQRVRQVARATEKSAQRKAHEEARRMTRILDDILVEGGFYEALKQVIDDFVTYPYAVLKGPVVRRKTRIVWRQGEDGALAVAEDATDAIMTWERVDPANIWWTPGSTTVEDAIFIEKLHYLASDLEEFIGLPGFDSNALRAVIDEYGESGFRFDMEEPPNADESTRTSTTDNLGRFIEVLEYNGRLAGSALQEFEFDNLKIEPDRTYYVQVWVSGDYVLFVDVSEDPAAMPAYYIAQYDPIPGSMVGLALPELLSDMQDSANAVIRALVQNVAFASGPQVVVDIDRCADRSVLNTLVPWRQWFVTNDPINNSGQPPVTFSYPQLNAGELITTLQTFINLADEVSGIPRYVAGSGRVGGAGRTASGLAMLMDRALKVLEILAQTIDERIITPAIERVYSTAVKTRPDFRGDVRVVVESASMATKRETIRARLLEFLNLTSNQIDLQLIGIEGRARILQEIARTLGVPVEYVVPDPEQLAAAQQMANEGAKIGPGPAPAVERPTGATPQGGPSLNNTAAANGELGQ